MRLSQPTRESADRMAPLLRSIAKEVMERSFTIVKLEEESKALVGTHEAKQARAATLVAKLANQKLELRRSVEELSDLGWERDPEQPLLFRAKGLTGESTYTWRPEDSFFYRSAQI
jgi:hypothetical protein